MDAKPWNYDSHWICFAKGGLYMRTKLALANDRQYNAHTTRKGERVKCTAALQSAFIPRVWAVTTPVRETFGGVEEETWRGGMDPLPLPLHHSHFHSALWWAEFH